ncbi:serine hydrolase [Clostridium felsineum]|uniref:serine hydrolase n=1 Tax=Clostridium felsineum TaxID=36839 RepID=UPI00098C3770|nr:serine hydrolase [Clostridium felsineum]URZ02565.1 hypothetical protein CLAUR_025770 [Clostridium felsineum]
MYDLKALDNAIKNILALRCEDISLVFLDLNNTSNYIYINENKIFPSASTIKVLILAEALNEVLNGKLSLDAPIEVKTSDKVPYSILTSLTNNKYPLIDLLTLMIISSDNTASNILIDLLTMDSINNYGQSIGLKNTSLKRKMMDSKAVQRGMDNLTSALDMLTLFKKIYNHELLNPKMCDLILKILGNNTDKEVLLRYLDADIRCAHKTGDLSNLNHDIGVFKTKTSEYILGVFVRNADFNYVAKDLIGKVSKIVYDFLTCI